MGTVDIAIAGSAEVERQRSRRETAIPVLQDGREVEHNTLDFRMDCCSNNDNVSLTCVYVGPIPRCAGHLIPKLRIEY